MGELPDFTFQTGVNQGQKTTRYTQQMESTTTPERSKVPSEDGETPLLQHCGAGREGDGDNLSRARCGNPNMWGEILSHS
jgi:hypothetical protein